MPSYVQFIETDSKLVLWFSLSNDITQIGDILYGAVYVPPENSKYKVDLPYEEIQNELDSLTSKYTHQCFIGDWNSRINQNMKNYICPDFDILHENGLEDLFYEFQTDFYLKDTNTCLERNTQDKSSNNYGYGNKMIFLF